MAAPESERPRLAVEDYVRLFHAAPIALLAIRAEGLVMVEANAGYLEAVGMSLGDIAGRPVFDVFPNSPIRGYDQATDLREFMQHAIDEQTPQVVKAMRYDIPDGEGGFDVRWWNVVEVPILDDDGVQYLLHYTEDVTALIHAREELTRTEAARDTSARQVAGLAEVALSLASAETVDDLARILVERGLALVGSDAGALVSRSPDGNWRVTEGGPRSEQVEQVYGTMPFDSSMPAPAVARTGTRVLLPTRESGLQYDGGMEYAYEVTGRSGWAFVPLAVGGEVFGCITVGWVDEHECTEAELDIIDALAAQCALALRRMQLVETQLADARRIRDLAEALQHAMLTAPPELPGLDIAVRYRPADDVAQVGGDWYDAFAQPDGAAMIVIGDVSGHDHVAAAKMGQLRGLLRALAYNADGSIEAGGADTPARVMTRLETSSRGLGVDSLATAIVARIEPRADDPSVLVLQWSNAGNPPPVVLQPDGTTTLLDPKPDLLLGVDADVVRHDRTVEVPFGATLFLYTDGLIERRDASIDQGIMDLRTALAGLVNTPLDELCDAVLARLEPHTGEDDIAMIAVRAS